MPLMAHPEPRVRTRYFMRVMGVAAVTLALRVLPGLGALAVSRVVGAVGVVRPSTGAILVQAATARMEEWSSSNTWNRLRRRM